MHTEVDFRLAGGQDPLLLVPASVNGSQDLHGHRIDLNEEPA